MKKANIADWLGRASLTLATITLILGVTVGRGIADGGGGGNDPGDPTPHSWYCNDSIEPPCPSGCTKASTWSQIFSCCSASVEQPNDLGWSSPRCCQYDCTKWTCTGQGCTFVVNKVFLYSDPNATCQGAECSVGG